MRKQIVTVALAGTVGLAGAALLGPGTAAAQDASASPGAVSAVADRVSRIKDALTGLVTDRTLTQAQADRVAETLADELPGRGHGGPGGRGERGGLVDPAATAEVLGITVEELRTAQQAGKTLAQVAEAEGVSRADLVSGLVAAAKAELAERVTAGRLTQAQADEIGADLTARVTERIDKVGRGGHRHGGDAPVPVPSASAGATPSAGS